MESLATVAPEAPTAGSDVAALLQEMREMRAMLAKQAAAPANDVPVRAPARTVGVLWDAYAKSFRDGPPRWTRQVPRFLDAPFDFEGAKISLRDQPWTRLTPQMGAAWWEMLRATTAGIGTPNRQEGAVLTPAYCNRLKSALSGCFSYHMKMADRADSLVRSDRTVDHVSENPLRRWPTAGTDELGRRGEGFESDEQLDSFLKCAHPLLAEMALMSVWCGGMRRNEVRTLRFAWVDFFNKTITLPRSATKTKTERTFPVNERCMAILERRRLTKKSEYVFPAPGSPAGFPLSETTMENWVREARRRWGQTLNGEKVVFHHFRHTFAKWSLLYGDPDSVVMQFGGWTTFEVFKVYSKINAALISRSRLNKNRTIKEIFEEAKGRNTAPVDRRSAHRASRHDIRPRENTEK